MKTKRLLAAILAVAMILGMMSFPAFAETDWEAQEITITTAGQLAELAQKVNEGTTFEGKTITLGNAIELSGEWTPIGNKEAKKYFCGTFDGAGFEISGLQISNATSGDYLALFGATKNATVKNLTVSGSVQGDNVAGIVARMDGGRIASCVNKANVTAVNTSKSGGIVCLAGATADLSLIEGCKNVGTVTVDGTSTAGAAGIVSYISNKGLVEVKDCVNEGTISNGNYVGGIVAYAMGGSSCTISGCENIGSVTTSGNAGGIAGFVGGSTGNRVIANCTNSGSITGATACGITGLDQGGVSVNNANEGTLTGTTTNDISGGTSITIAVAKIGDTYYSSLQAAFGAATDGDIVELFSGTYEEAITMPLKSLTLRGSENTLLKGGIQFATGEVPEGTEITIEGLSFEGKGIKLVGWGATKPIENAKTLTIRNNKFNNIQGEKNIYAIHINNSDDAIAGLSIIDNEFYNNETGAFYATAYGELVITGNKIVNSGMNGGTLYFIDKKGNAANSVTITNNQFIEWGLNQNDAGDYEGRALRLDKFADGSVIDITNNVFLCTNPPEQHLKATGIHDGSTINLNQNYWGTEIPDFDSMLETGGKVKVTTYYQTFAEDGTLTDLVAAPEDLTQVTKKIELEAVEDSNKVNVYIAGTDENGITAIVENLVAVDLALEITEGAFSIAEVDVPVELKDKWDISVVGEKRYLVKEIGISHEDMENPGEDLGNANNDLDGSRIHIATITLEGYGSGTLKAVGGDGTNDAAQRAKSDNIVLSSNLAETTANLNIAVPTQNLTINVRFPNAVVDNAAAYQDMKVVISGGDLSAAEEYQLGTDGTAMTDGVYTITTDLTKDRAYTVTVSGEGYRTARYTVTMTEDKTLNFWNNVKDNAVTIEDGKTTGAVTKNFLAGDIVKDNNINIYDLSAVVSYFGTDGLSAENNPAYAKYDLNRDGKIDSKDVAYVLVSWGE